VQSKSQSRRPNCSCALISIFPADGGNLAEDGGVSILNSNFHSKEVSLVKTVNNVEELKRRRGAR
jgi:hypothetical protein